MRNLNFQTDSEKITPTNNYYLEVENLSERFEVRVFQKNYLIPPTFGGEKKNV